MTIPKLLAIAYEYKLWQINISQYHKVGNFLAERAFLADGGCILIILSIYGLLVLHIWWSGGCAVRVRNAAAFIAPLASDPSIALYQTPYAYYDKANT